MNIWSALILTLQLASVSTCILLFISIPLAWWLARCQTVVYRGIVEAVVALPLVLPPTVVGFYLLVIFAPTTLLGQMWLSVTGHTLAFSFSGLVVGSVLYSLPFVVQPIQAAFTQFPNKLLDAAAVLGASPTQRFFNLVLPSVWRSVLVAASLGFAHTIGEFGIVLMIGGSIPEETRVLSIALYEYVEMTEYARAHTIASILVIFSFILLFCIYVARQKIDRH